MFSKIELRYTKPNQLRDKYAFMHRHLLARRYIISYYSIKATEFDLLLCAYSYASFTSDILKLATRSESFYLMERLKDYGFTKYIKKKNNMKIYALTRKGRAMVEEYYEMLVENKDFEVHFYETQED